MEHAPLESYNILVGLSPLPLQILAIGMGWCHDKYR